MELQREISFEKNQAKIGKTLRVLVEREEDGEFFGRTEADAPEVDAEIKLISDDKLITGSFVHAIVTEAEDFDLIGRVA
jgi:ribosomal protein S12 methylthiotransferase